MANTYENKLIVYKDGKLQKIQSDDALSMGGDFTAANLEATVKVLAAQLEVTGDASIGGDLMVTGDIISRGEVSLLVQDNFIDLAAGNFGASALPGGFSVTMKKATGFTVLEPTAFTAGVQGVSAPKFTVASGANTVAAGDIVQISDTSDGSNDGIYVVASVAGSDITIKGIGGTLSTVPFIHNNFTTKTGETAKASKIDLAAVAVSDGVLGNAPIGTLVYAYAAPATEAGFAASEWVMVGGGLQEAYNAGNTIELAGGRNLAISAPVSGAAAITLAANDDSSFSVDGAQLTLEGSSITLNATVSGGAASMQEADGAGVSFNSGAFSMSGLASSSITVDGSDLSLTALGMTIDSGASIAATAAQDITLGASGAAEITAAAASKFEVTGASLSLKTLNSGKVEMVAAGAAEIVAAAASKFEVTAHDLAIKTLTSGDINLEAAGILNMDADSATLDAAGAISLDAGAASNFSVDGADLTLSTLNSGKVAMTAAGAAEITAAAASKFEVTGAALDLATLVTGDINLAAVDILNADASSMTFDASESISLDAASASNFTVAGDHLTLSTTGSGDLELSAASVLNADAASMTFDASGSIVVTSSANKIDLVAAAASKFEAEGGLSLKSLTSGDVALDSAANITLDGADILASATEDAVISGAVSAEVKRGEIAAGSPLPTGLGAHVKLYEDAQDATKSAIEAMAAGAIELTSSGGNVSIASYIDSASDQAVLGLSAQNADAGGSLVQIGAKEIVAAAEQRFVVQDSADSSTKFEVSIESEKTTAHQKVEFKAEAGFAVTAEAAVEAGHVLCLKSNGSYDLADNDAAGAQEVVGVALAAGGAEELMHSVAGLPVYMKFDATPSAVGSAVYLSEVAGKATQTAPVAGRVYRLGVLKSAVAQAGLYHVIWMPAFVADLS
jgi:hypothetical protein